MEPLMWVDCNDTYRPRSRLDQYELRSAVKRHVRIYALTKPHSHCTSDERRHQVKKRKKLMSSTHSASPTASFIKQHCYQRSSDVLYSPQNALVPEADKQVAEAAWWHHHKGSVSGPGINWRNKCKSIWNHGLWEFAASDATLRAIFIALAAAKEASIRGLNDSLTYHRFKGVALALVQQDLQEEGHALRLHAVAAVCLLCKIAFIEGDWATAEAHCKALVVLAAKRLSDVPNVLHRFLTWADLRLCFALSRAPLLPYSRHRDFCLPVPNQIKIRAKAATESNSESLPQGWSPMQSQFTGDLLLALEYLHQMAIVYETDDMDWKLAWQISYDSWHFIASFQQEVLSLGSIVDKIMLISIEIQLVGIHEPFVPQNGFQRHLFQLLTETLSHMRPKALFETWSRTGGSLDALLWAYFNAAVSSTHFDSSKISTVWVMDALRALIRILHISSFEAFCAKLKSWPWCHDWSAKGSSLVWEWLNTEQTLEDLTNNEPSRHLFKNLRLTFDADIK